MEAVARRYARALLDVAMEEGSEDAVKESLVQWRNRLDTRGWNAVSAPNLSSSDEEAVLLEALPEGSPDLLTRLARVLAGRKRGGIMRVLPGIFSSLLDERRGITRARIETAVPLGDKESEAIRVSLEKGLGRRIRPSFSVEPDLIGGVRARVGDDLIDLSVKGELDRARRRLRMP